MDSLRRIGKHVRIQIAIVEACQRLGVQAIPEYSGNGWRADVYIPNKERPVAFEIQLSAQSLNRTLERQSKYIRDGIIGCWLFENPISKLTEERLDLPVFFVEEKDDSTLFVNLGDRRKVDLQTFLENFILNNIQFKSIAITREKQKVELVFYDMGCWKCHELNQLYYVDSLFYSACNAEIQPEEALWESNNIEYHPEIIKMAQRFIQDRKDLELNLGPIKQRFSKTVDNSYLSFGCFNCDCIFGDWYVRGTKLEMRYEPKKIVCQGEIHLSEHYVLHIPHWCLPDDNKYCN